MAFLIAGMLVLGATVPVAAQTAQAGAHIGAAAMSGPEPLGDETNFEYGFWVGMEFDDRIDVIADWTRIERPSFRLTPEGFTVGEDGRNRQIVDLVFRYHFARSNGFRLFAEFGGGAYWNNRQVYNPQGYPGFTPDGKQSTYKNMWTIGAGLRRNVVPHLDWILQTRFHNLGCRDADAIRVITGLMVTFR
jgi:opacity protein-like surface antigen